MKDTIKYKLLSSFIMFFALLVSLSFPFFVGTKSVDGNVTYWVFKVIALVWILAIIVGIWLQNANFSKLFPLAIISIIVQGIPAFLRIGWANEHKVMVGLVYLFAIVMFILMIFSLLFAISNKRFKKAEDKAKPSSNAK